MKRFQRVAFGHSPPLGICKPCSGRVLAMMQVQMTSQTDFFALHGGLILLSHAHSPVPRPLHLKAARALKR